MSKPRFLKPVLIGCACLVPVGLIVGLSVNWDHTKTISCIGSGGVKPFVESFGEEFRKSNDGYDVTVDTGGSTFGITQVANGYCNLGDASKNPYDDIHKTDSILESWQDNKMKTITIGWEAVGILYCVPDGLSNQGKKDIDLYVCHDNINYLFAAFSGFDEYLDSDGNVQKLEKNDERTSFYGFLTPTAKSKLSANDKIICKNTQITPVVRSGAATIANSAYSFARETNLDPHVTDKQYDALVGGQYGTDRTIFETDESNAKGYSVFDRFASTYSGCMVYLTSAFTEPTKTKELIASHENYKFMSYQAIDSDEIKAYSYDNYNEGYSWIRPLNIMCSTNSSHSKYSDNLKFLEFIFEDYGTENGRYESTLKKAGAKGLKQSEYDSMKLNDKFVCDTELESSRSGLDKIIYGAVR